jgi:hypothetical protein
LEILMAVDADFHESRAPDFDFQCEWPRAG